MLLNDSSDMICFLRISPLVSMVTQHDVTVKSPHKVAHGRARFFGKYLFAKIANNQS